MVRETNTICVNREDGNERAMLLNYINYNEDVGLHNVQTTLALGNSEYG